LSVFETRRQQLDLARLHEECELNYKRLHRIIPDSRSLGANFSLHYRAQPNKQPSRAGMKLTIIEVTKYTSTVKIVADRAGPMWLPEIEIKVRVYRDARMAEVVEWCSDRTIPWALVEKNGMQARDEKWQWNMFLSELLSHGLGHGISALEV
jgi:uncharacterized protein YqiB (DUF1249 family)